MDQVWEFIILAVRGLPRTNDLSMILPNRHDGHTGLFHTWFQDGKLSA